MKSVDPGILEKSNCFTLEPAEFARQNLKYLTWCGHYYCTSKYFMDRETYPYCLLLSVRSGEMDVTYKGEEYLIKKGDVLLLNCNYPQRYQARDGLEFLYIHYDGGASHAMTDQIINNHGTPVFHHRETYVSPKIYELVEKYEHGHAINMFQEDAFIGRLLAKLSLPKISETDADDPESSPVETAVQYIQNHIGEDISLDDLARLVALSPYYFAHTFKKKTGYAPAEYVLKTRMERARMLLVHSKKTIAEIAYDVGYSAPASFTNVFKKKLGLSPRAYRLMEQGTAGVQVFTPDRFN